MPSLRMVYFSVLSILSFESVIYGYFFVVSKHSPFDLVFCLAGSCYVPNLGEPFVVLFICEGPDKAESLSA
jgi:hypothetical protein